MIRPALLLAMVALVSYSAVAMESPAPSTFAEQAETETIRKGLSDYSQAFNDHDAAMVASHWAQDCVSFNPKTGEITGREALKDLLAGVFVKFPSLQYEATADEIVFPAPNVALVGGKTTHKGRGESVYESVYSAVLVKSDSLWPIVLSNECPLPSVFPYPELEKFEGLIGTWTDTTNSDIAMTVSWSPLKAFLVRTNATALPADQGGQLVQVMGWDPNTKKLRTWTINGDGMVTEGTVTSDDAVYTFKAAEGAVNTPSPSQTIARKDASSLIVETKIQAGEAGDAGASQTVMLVRKMETSDKED